MDRAAGGGFLRGFSAPNGVSSARRVSHLLFADDILVFCDADMDQLTYLKQVLQWFQIVSGLKINLGKCKVGSLPTTYPGLQLGASHKDTTVWNPVIERVEKRLVGWQKRYLSKGGKEVLIKNTLSSMPTYYLSLLQAPVSITEKLERLQRNFLWDATDGTRKLITFLPSVVIGLVERTAAICSLQRLKCFSDFLTLKVLSQEELTATSDVPRSAFAIFFRNTI
ncbi:PREDICTED: uncharacterized protein LOC109230047 [Nicotiana attenuata]|uniref:uncharacterized protein LOC109230047 n=1 Tax=Nicotiana attenuata TaxID=49451 RepID=UPI00090504F9|nr:PREDICTED: uncharacterized protein LOC109230047 [Nicotiana attenuata]